MNKLKKMFEKETTVKKELLLIIISIIIIIIYYAYYDIIQQLIPSSLDTIIRDRHGKIVIRDYSNMFTQAGVIYKYAILSYSIELISKCLQVISIIIGVLKIFLDNKSNIIAKLMRVCRLFIMTTAIVMIIAIISLMIFKELFQVKNNYWVYNFISHTIK